MTSATAFVPAANASASRRHPPVRSRTRSRRSRSRTERMPGGRTDVQALPTSRDGRGRHDLGVRRVRSSEATRSVGSTILSPNYSRNPLQAGIWSACSSDLPTS